MFEVQLRPSDKNYVVGWRKHRILFCFVSTFSFSFWQNLFSATFSQVSPFGCFWFARNEIVVKVWLIEKRQFVLLASSIRHSHSLTLSHSLSLSLVHSLTPVHTHSLSLSTSFFLSLSLSRVGKIILRFSLMTDKWLKKTRNLHLQRESRERERERAWNTEKVWARAREREWVRVAMHPLKHYFCVCESAANIALSVTIFKTGGFPEDLKSLSRSESWIHFHKGCCCCCRLENFWSRYQTLPRRSGDDDGRCRHRVGVVVGLGMQQLTALRHHHEFLSERQSPDLSLD